MTTIWVLVISISYLILRFYFIFFYYYVLTQKMTLKYFLRNISTKVVHLVCIFTSWRQPIHPFMISLPILFILFILFFSLFFFTTNLNCITWHTALLIFAKTVTLVQFLFAVFIWFMSSSILFYFFSFWNGSWLRKCNKYSCVSNRTRYTNIWKLISNDFMLRNYLVET